MKHNLFDRIFANAIDRRIAEYQNDIISKHCAEVENIYQQMRGWRHDYHNQISTMLALIGDDERLREYLLKLNKDLSQVDTVVKTGNVMVDAILNSKLSVIGKKKIDVNVEVTVPQEFSISEVDLCTVIGNLLDNAMENAGEPAGEYRPWIRIFLGMMKENLYISVANSVFGEVRKKGGQYLSTKKEPDRHGFGLRRIDRIVKKYNGYLNRQSEQGAFVTEIMLPTDTVHA